MSEMGLSGKDRGVGVDLGDSGEENEGEYEEG